MALEKYIRPIIKDTGLSKREVLELMNDQKEELKGLISDNNIVIPFSIFLYLQHSEYEPKIKNAENEFNIQFKNFKNLSEKSMLVINRIIKWDKEGYVNKIEGSIYEIMNKIISFIDESCN